MHNEITNKQENKEKRNLKSDGGGISNNVRLTNFRVNINLIQRWQLFG